MNKVTMIGNLTADPELRSTSRGTPVCKFTIAVNRRYKGKDGNAVTDFFTVIVWRQLGELCAKYLAKGRKCAVIGELQNRSYDAKDGTKRYATEIIADEVEFLTPRSDAAGTSNQAKAAAPAAAPAAPTAAPAAAYAPAYAGTPGGFDMDRFEEIDDDELPF